MQFEILFKFVASAAAILCSSKRHFCHCKKIISYFDLRIVFNSLKSNARITGDKLYRLSLYKGNAVWG